MSDQCRACGNDGIDPIAWLGAVYDAFARADRHPEWAAEVFPVRDPSYDRECQAAFNRGFESVWSKADDESKLRFVALLLREGRWKFKLNVPMLIERNAELEARIAAAIAETVPALQARPPIDVIAAMKKRLRGEE